MKTIAIDIDNVLADSAESFVRISNELFDDHITVADFNEDWQKMWGVGHEEAERRGEVLREHEYQKGYLPIAGAAQAIDELGKRYKLVLVTSRRKFAEQLTRTGLASTLIILSKRSYSPTSGTIRITQKTVICVIKVTCTFRLVLIL